MTATVTTLLTRREEVHAELEHGDRHLVHLLKNPEPEMESAPLGDVLCWCEGLDEAAATVILAAARLNWGRRLSLLTWRDIAAVCWAVKTHFPGPWERWREVREGRAAA